MKPANKELVGASTSLLVMGVLRRGPNYGYDIVRHVNEEASGVFTWQEGTIYPLLRKLESQGLVRSRWQTVSGAAATKERKYYSLTPLGRSTLVSGVSQWNLFHSMVLRIAGATHA
jgi:PadR family transcriptional regulator PadR